MLELGELRPLVELRTAEISYVSINKILVDRLDVRSEGGLKLSISWLTPRSVESNH